MGLTNSQLDQVMREYDRRQLADQADQTARIRYAMEKVPGLRELDQAVSDLSVERSRALLGDRTEDAVCLAQQLKDLKEQKAVLLASAGLPADFMNKHYTCPDCRDTGYIEGQKCRCLKQAIVDFLFAQYPIRDQLSKENFDTFSFDYFDTDRRDPVTGKTSLENMRKVYETCREFADSFIPGRKNLLFTGPAGTGKTFLSNCIADALIRQGFSVVYLPAGRLFETLADATFERTDASKDSYSYILESDLLIIDDLGAEMNNSFINSQLFFCLNERNLRKRSTLISTNLTLNQMRDNYTERVTSRLVEQYVICHFFNSDIRVKKRLQGVVS